MADEKVTETIEENSIEYLTHQLEKQTKMNKKIRKEIKEMKKKATINQVLTLEAPYVHCKITKILGGKGKKGEISISAGGSIEKINTDDVHNFSEMLVQKINERIDYALQEMKNKEETD